MIKDDNLTYTLFLPLCQLAQLIVTLMTIFDNFLTI